MSSIHCYQLITVQDFTLTHQINSAPFVSGVVPAGTIFAAGVNIITYSLTDGVNTVTCSFTVTVLDTQAPVIDCPGAITLTPNTAGCLSSYTLTIPDATDNCTSNLTVSYSVLNPDNTISATFNATQLEYTFGVGNSQVRWIFTDASGNSSYCIQMVSVVNNATLTSTVLTENVCNANPGVGSVLITANEAGTVTINGVSQSVVAPLFQTTFTGLNAGYYSAIFVSNSAGCSAESSFSIINLNSNLTASVSVSDPLCNGQTVTANITANDGTGPYTYILNNQVSNNTGEFIGLTAGDYNVLVTDINGCSYYLAFDIDQPTQLISEVVLTNNVTCYGLSNGNASLNISGGVTPYTYSWSHNTSLNAPIATGLTAGTYFVTITDFNGCSVVETMDIFGPSAPLSISGSNISDASCFGTSNGSIDITVVGGTAPYYYVWSNGLATQDISSLDAGVYNVTITDANGCSIVSNNFTVQEPDQIVVFASSIINTQCNASVGSVLLTSSEPGVFTVNGVSQTVNINNQTTFANLSAGYYTAILRFFKYGLSNIYSI
jgi:large repetitive protein